MKSRPETTQQVVGADPELEPLFDVAYVSKMFSVGKETVRDWIRTGHLHAVKVGNPPKYWRVPRSELIRFADSKYGNPETNQEAEATV